MKVVAETLGVARSNLIDRLNNRTKPRRRYYKAQDGERLTAKKVAAMFVTSPAPKNPLASAEDDAVPAQVEISPGQIVRLDLAEDVTVGQPADSGATYEPSQYRTLLQTAAALDIPYLYLIKDLEKGNFPSSLLTLIEFSSSVSAWQHSVMVWLLCRPVYARWMDAAVLSDTLTQGPAQPECGGSGLVQGTGDRQCA